MHENFFRVYLTRKRSSDTMGVATGEEDKDRREST